METAVIATTAALATAPAMVLVFDTETTGLPLWSQPSDDPGQPHVVEIACELWSGDELVETFHSIVNPGVPIPEEVSAIHGITTEIAQEKGIPKAEMIARFLDLVAKAGLIVGHNVSFDCRMMRIENARVNGEKWEPPVPRFCTMHKSRKAIGGSVPTLTAAVAHFFNEDHPDAHSALADCQGARRVYFHLITLEN